MGLVDGLARHVRRCSYRLVSARNLDRITIARGAVAMESPFSESLLSSVSNALGQGGPVDEVVVEPVGHTDEF